MYKSTLTMLRIKDKNIIISETITEDKYKGHKSLFFYTTLTYKSSHCDNCLAKNENYSIIKNGKKFSTITLLRIMERPAYLKLKKQRFYCKNCDSYFTAKSEIVDNYCFISNTTKLAVLDKAQDYRSQKSIAKSCLVSSMTVTRIINKGASQVYHSSFNALPEHLMMDEFKSVKYVTGKMSFIYADAISHRIVDAVADRKLNSLKKHFYRYSLKLRQSVKTVTIDMYTPYMSLIKELFPKAKIILDRFHIVQSLNRALNMSRVSIMNQFRNTHRPLYNKYKAFWKLFLKLRESLEIFNYKKVRLFKEWKTEKGIIDYLLTFDSQLFNTYLYVHELRRLLKENRVEKLIDVLFSINLSEISMKLRPVIRTLRKLAPLIENTINYSNLTNGPIEGINNKIKLIKRVSFGYRNYDNLRNRIIISSRLFAPIHKKDIKQLEIA
ncbi:MULTISPECIES: ISL3 family transposase [Staphylococcus]|uniref:ISL3 family transposase n=1 Tax=Staphylococcus TaxID=1279 RepID=UPI00076B289B|nr:MULTISPECIES: ISL3 family transposase [Staphylococcus]AMG64525.1 ISL3 family transposase [Staphylococcus lugdunensis]MCI2816149.1 ISL3 family transposase [Staphylococcus lugdunensis]MDU0967412.1 ISL3 family transposase [Staphylococcus lugdunensis]MDU1965748.1 ISL3 family transposase [Staphylococcus lugdunensis]MDU2323036.1 ISL3 family transposase [Staphylococcus lugdunensis]